jgi:RHS repeat-associated protein
MTSLLRALCLRARVSSLNCSLFVALKLVRLARRRRTSRPRQRPARSRYAYSGFRRFACLGMITVMFVQFTLFPPEVSHAAVKAVSATAVGYGQDAHFWWHSSGWAARYERLRNEYLPNIGAQAQPRGWDGKGAPRQSRPAPQAVETQQDRERKVARVKIFPGDVEIKTGEQVVFNAIAFDQDGNAVGGLDVKWGALHEEKNHPLTISHGRFVSGIPGKFIVTAEVAGRKEHVKVTVSGEPRRPNLKSRSAEPKSSRESRRIGSLRAPTSGDQKRIARRSRQAGMPALPGRLRAASAPMAARTALFLEDDTGWNSTNNDTADDVGSERGPVPGRAVDGGVGSANFQFAAPAVVMDGRGIDLSMLFNYNSRVWHKAGSEITFDIDRDWVPGWSLGFGKIVMAGDTYMLIDDDGARHPYEGTLRGSFPAPATSLQTFEAHTTDGTFIDYYAEGYKPQFDNSGGKNMIVAWSVMPNGTRIEYGAQANYAMYPTRITDAHGNFISITYLNNEGPRIQTITDTLGRGIYFNYDLSGLLTSIVVPGLSGASRVAVRLQYQWLTLSNAGANYGFAGGLTTKVRQNTIPVIRAIYYPGTGTGYWFGDGDSYSPYGMIRKVSERRGMTFDNAPLDQQGNIGAGAMSREMVYDYPQFGGSYSDMPTYTQMTEDWAGRATASAPVTSFSVVDSSGTRTTTITRPDGAQLTQVTDNNQSSSTYGMLLEDAHYQDSSHSVVLSRSKAFWEIGVYNSPRPWRTEAYDERGRMTATTFSYDPAYGSLYNSVTDARAYGYGGELLRRARTEYLNNANYNGFLQNSGTLWWKQFGPPSGGPNWSGSHIFNLASLTEVYAADDVTRLSRTEYQYDGPGLINNPGIVQHNHWYNPHTPPQEECGSYPDPDDPDCNGQCGPCQNPPCPEPPPNCDGNCNQIPFCNYIPQYDPRTWYRGNVTQIKSYADAASLDQSTAVVETRTYDIAGNVRVQSSSCCEQTTITCTTNTQYAWPESQTSGSPTDTTKQNTSSATYDYNTGLVMTSTDANGRVSQTEYDLNTLRPVREYSPTNAYQYHIYDDLNLKVEDYVYESGQIGANVASRSDKYLDGLGRAVKEVAFGKDYVRDVVETMFDNLGRAWRQTRPYRANSDLSPAETVQWITVAYDSLDRQIQTVSPDGSIVTRAYNSSPDPPGSSGQPGDTIKVTDPWQRERWARTDELGRLVEVAEPNPGGNGSLSGGAMYTIYNYDALDRLLQVNQGVQTRRFRYDSLGRLTHQKLAERAATLDDNGNYVGGGTWSDFFQYDTRSNLTMRAEARGVRTYFNFDDPLNRLQWVQYNKDTVPPYLAVDIPGSYGVSYPNINVGYSYMTSGDKRRVRTVSLDGAWGNQTIDYDVEGRVSQVYQTFGAMGSYPLVTNYLWDTLDRMKEVTYPKQYGAGDARKVVTHNYDIASRIDSLQFGGVTLASNPVYNASSQVTSLAVGSQTTENYNFDPKTGLLLSQQVNKGPEQLVNLQYNYTLTNDSNNNGPKTGQLTSVTDMKNTARNRAYEYDKLGRLSKVKGGVNAFSNPAWYQNYSYDRYGNRSMVEQNGDAVWVDDALPAGSSAGSDGGDNWKWLGHSPTPYSGTVSHQSIIAAETHQHYFYGPTPTLQVNAGDRLYAYIYLDPANKPTEVMLQWHDGGNWEHRAYWGANDISWGTDGTESRRYMGPLPAAGGWVRLEVTASAVGLEGRSLNGMAFTLHSGKATWDQAGKANGGGDTVWIDDALPAGTVGYNGGEDWTWVGPSPNPQSGVVSHQSNIASAFHQHYFWGASQTLQVNVGDKLYAYVYLDPTNTPSEVMLQWNDGAGWEHRAYWGSNNIPYGTDGTDSRRYMGPLPAAGAWVKLEVPANLVGLEGKTLNGMAFTLYGGRANWDKAGKTRGIASSMPLDGLANIAYNPSNNRISTAGFTYDAAGNQTRAVMDASGVQQGYQYDCAGRLARVLDGNGNELARYVYGEGNQRLMSIEGGVTKFFAWAGGQIIAEYEASGANALVWKTSYVYLGGRLLATTSGTGGTETRFHHPDRLGTRLVTDAGGTVVSEQFTLPFGNMQPFTSVYGGENPYQNPTLGNPSKKRFTSYDRSDATGLDYAVNRFYSPQQGRFTQVDPIGMGAVILSDPQTLNLYSYCGNDPINCVDPDGLLFGWLKKVFKAIGKFFKSIVKIVVSIVLRRWVGTPSPFGPHGPPIGGTGGIGGVSSFVGQQDPPIREIPQEYLDIVSEEWSLLEDGTVLYEVTMNVAECITWNCVWIAIKRGVKIGAMKGVKNVLGSPEAIITTILTRGRFKGRSNARNARKRTSYPRDAPDEKTVNWSAHFNSEAEARALARAKLGKNPVEVEPNKWRSADGKWQYRAKPGDVGDNHIHLEELDPATGTVKRNLHLRWNEGTERKQ